MKPKDLKPPTHWDDRRVMVQDRVWYVPECAQENESYVFPGWGHTDFFGNDKPVVVEYCSGNGTWIAGKALTQPEYNWVGVEIRFDRVRKIWSKIQNGKLANLLVLCGEARAATQRYFPSATVDQIFVNFPDPWPKKRHAKHRLFTPAFIDEMARVLKPDGTIFVVTDDPVYSEALLSEFLIHPGYLSVYAAPYYVTDVPGYGASFFDTLWREKGRVIRYHQFRKTL